ncbi:hypothetical protein [Streptomyces formicae]|uniref:Uncharacterized protein n=1 Tax=Streptomyces formicae TaxID=1616117 RepID=A0ABY3WTQ6_9ACTN|nr:hypothetical protein [Streptomyces formicae]UNM14859.1 hypothetical protein J4032_28375 [Streptomyces formicae]
MLSSVVSPSGTAVACAQTLTVGRNVVRPFGDQGHNTDGCGAVGVRGALAAFRIGRSTLMCGWPPPR